MASLSKEEPILYEITPSVLLVDIDNTLIPSCEVIAETRIAMRDVLVNEVPGHDPEVIQGAMKKHYQKHGINDYKLLQGLAEQEVVNASQFSQLMPAVRQAYHDKRANHMRPFEGVVPLLQACMEAGIEVGGLTDDDHIESLIKLGAPQTKVLQEGTCMSWLVAKHSGSKYQDPYSSHAMQRALERFEYPTDSIDHMKPHTDLEMILGLKDLDELSPEERLTFISQNVAILGDNWKNDMGLAKRYNMRGYYAAWGHSQILRYREAMRSFMSQEHLDLFAPIPYQPTAEELGGQVRIVEHPQDVMRFLQLESRQAS